VLPKLNMEADDIAATGVVQEWKDFTWKSLLDGFACTECARCTNFCPAYNTGKPLSPMQVVHDLRDDLRFRMPDRGPLDVLLERFQHGESPEAQRAEAEKPLIGTRTTEETLWACTTCGACQEVCPVFIDHPEKIIQMRQNLVLVQEKTPPDLARTFTNLERNGNPWGTKKQEQRFREQRVFPHAVKPRGEIVRNNAFASQLGRQIIRKTDCHRIGFRGIAGQRSVIETGVQLPLCGLWHRF
jgi:heterodisulfide reductase subunit C